MPEFETDSLHKVALVAALQREVRPLVKRWRTIEREHEGRRFRFYESGHAVMVCGGIGAEAARRATEAVIALYQPELVQSVGFAGALDSELKVGETFSPSSVVDARDGSSVETGTGRGVLVSAAAVAGAEQKAKLALSYGAQAVDMEAAAVARGAQAHGIAFRATRAISDEASFTMPALDRFVDASGQFRTGRFVIFTALRPWLWGSAIHLARNSAKASRALCAELDRSINQPEAQEHMTRDLHPMSKAAN
jgi:adenosylhomocysteine nucleosidase